MTPRGVLAQGSSFTIHIVTSITIIVMTVIIDITSRPACPRPPSSASKMNTVVAQDEKRPSKHIPNRTDAIHVRADPLVSPSYEGLSKLGSLLWESLVHWGLPYSWKPSVASMLRGVGLITQRLLVRLPPPPLPICSQHLHVTCASMVIASV